MARTVLAVFESVFTAKLAVYDLIESGLSGEVIDILPRPQGALEAITTAPKKRHAVMMEVEQDGLGLGMRIGGSIGGALGFTGGMLSAAGALPLTLPNQLNITPLGMDGITILAGLLAGIVFGLITGGFFGSLAGLNIPEEEMRQYARTARQEPVMITVLADGEAVDPVIDILTRHNPLELTEKTFSLPQPGHAAKSRPRAEMPDGASDRR